MSDAVDGRSAARCRNTIARQNVTFLQRSEPPRAAARQTHRSCAPHVRRCPVPRTPHTNHHD
eukprot:5902210-Prymnesium_polylepis.1